jgi:hypothetical protein
MKTSSAQFLPLTTALVPANRSGRVEFGALVAFNPAKYMLVLGPQVIRLPPLAGIVFISFVAAVMEWGRFVRPWMQELGRSCVAPSSRSTVERRVE